MVSLGRRGSEFCKRQLSRVRSILSPSVFFVPAGGGKISERLSGFCSRKISENPRSHASLEIVCENRQKISQFSFQRGYFEPILHRCKISPARISACRKNGSQRSLNGCRENSKIREKISEMTFFLLYKAKIVQIAGQFFVLGV